MKTPKKLINGLLQEDCFLIATHINPDGDALGSSLALAEALTSLGKKVFLYDRDPVPKYYYFLAGHKKFSTDLRKALKADPVLVLLDCNSPERAALGTTTFRKNIVIDHHETAGDFGDLRWVEKDAAATGFLIYTLVRSLRLKITPAMATSLYTAIAVDTGTFRYSNTTEEVLQAAAYLVGAGAQPHSIAEHLYETWAYGRFRLFMLVMNTLDKKDGVAIVHVTTDMFSQTGTSSEDTENFANLPRRIDDVEVSVLLRETGSGAWKASLRSKGNANVAKVAEQFGGGGHKNAAGFRLSGDLATVKKTLLKALRKTLA